MKKFTCVEDIGDLHAAVAEALEIKCDRFAYTSLGRNRTLLMIVLMLIVIVVGLAMDVTPSILILTPIMIPLVEAAGINKVYFGVCFVLMNVLGLTSPPVGPVLNVACAAGNVKMDKIIGPTMPYFISQTILCFALAIFPFLVEVPMGWFGAA